MGIRSQSKSSFPIFALAFILFFVFTPFLFAEITVQNATGTIAITTPSGEVVTVEPGQAIPAIATGSSIEVISGTANIAATGTDTVNAMIGDSVATLSNGSEVGINVSASGDTALDVIGGSVTVHNADGSTETLVAGESKQAEALKPASSDVVEVPGENPANDPQGYA